jgi:hypothetical protein
MLTALTTGFYAELLLFIPQSRGLLSPSVGSGLVLILLPFGLLLLPPISVNLVRGLLILIPLLSRMMMSSSACLTTSFRFALRFTAGSPRFDADCRSAKRYTRRLGRAAASARRRLAASPDSAAAADAFVPANSAWLTQRCAYRQLRRRKCSSFWSNEFAAADSPQRIRSMVDRLLGRGHRTCDSVSADAL